MWCTRLGVAEQTKKHFAICVAAIFVLWAEKLLFFPKIFQQTTYSNGFICAKCAPKQRATQNYCQPRLPVPLRSTPSSSPQRQSAFDDCVFGCRRSAKRLLPDFFLPHIFVVSEPFCDLFLVGNINLNAVTFAKSTGPKIPISILPTKLLNNLFALNRQISRRYFHSTA